MATGLLLRPGILRSATSWRGHAAAALARTFSDGPHNQPESSPLFPPDPYSVKPGKMKPVGSFQTTIGAYGPLMDGPDYTFLDGRPTPLRAGQRKRARKQQEVAAKVLQLMKETHFAIERERQKQENEKLSRQHILDSKLKPKGHKMLKK